MYGGNEQKLYDDLFRDYNKKVRPVWNSSHIVNVSMTLSVYQIVEMDERNQILTTNVWIEQHWSDMKLKWNPVDYDGIEILRIPATEIWMPDITLYNNADSADYVSTSRGSNALIYFNGNVSLWSKPTLVRSVCKINIKYFPFDMQQCDMKFGSWTYTSFQMNLHKFKVKPDLSGFIQNEQWTLVYAIARRNIVSYPCCPESYHDVTFFFGLRRKPLYYIYNLLMPCMLLSSLSLLGFCMPYAVGVVKVSLSVTLILSLTVFLLLVAEMMPRTSEIVPVISQYYAATMFLIAFSTAMNVVVLNINGRGNGSAPVPHWLKMVVVDCLGSALCIARNPLECHKKNSQIPSESDFRNTYVEHHRGGTSQIVKRDGSAHSMGRNIRFGNLVPEHEILLEDKNGSPGGRGHFGGVGGEEHGDHRLIKLERSVDSILKHLKNSQRKKDKGTHLRQEWGAVARVLDRFLLLLFLTSSVVTSVILLSQKVPDKQPPSSNDTYVEDPE
ncbi:neuronal acetylcholine receptor subunit alpha-10-like [Anneissia japonica]|uniref:neuronal acetylcholine receptor subunit alpha-10-like n=1 Tax=Anneissia japonica TaxID=1529436 RepID=UPI0014255F0D|nr:neuronal acetylcholine receptor subunit alpha-10-like [Anneissia japonica]